MSKRFATRMTIAAVALAVCTIGPLSAQQPGAAQTSYSATAIHKLPDLPETSGRILKSGDNMRLEFQQNGRQIIQILLPSMGVMYVLDPQTKTYTEMRGQTMPATAASRQSVPCSEQSGLAVCQRVGADTVSGIQVERWLIAAQPQTQPLSLLWDPTRRQALRQDFPDGSSMAMRFKAMEDVNGRETEHWIIEVLAPGRETLTGGWWFDPVLRVVVREDLPGGESRRLENIVVGGVDATAFQVPEGWQQLDPNTIATPQAPQPASD